MQTYTHLSYTFNKVAQTVTLTGFTGSIEQIKLITDFTETTRTVIYDPASAGLGGSLAGSVLTLAFNTNTASFLNTDKLEIIIDPAVSATLALDGTDITTPFAMPAGGVGMRGWLSAIWTKINGSLAVTGTFFQATQPVSLATNTPTLQTGANVIGALIANQSVNTAQIGGVAPSMGSGVNGTGVQRVTLPTDRPPIADISAIGALAAAAQVVTLPLNGQSAGTGSITGIWVGTITWEGTIDGINYFPINAVSASTSSPQTTTTVNGLYRITPGGLTQMRANMSAFTSGSASIKLNASVGVGGTFVNQILPSKITDGTNTVAIFADGAGSFGLNTFLGGTNFPAAPGNTSTTQLGAGATFTGTIETMFLQQNIIININTDQPCTLVCNQYITTAAGTKMTPATFPIPASTGYMLSINALGNFFNLALTNNGGSATTTLNINTFYGTLPASTNLGNSPMALSEVNGSAFSLGVKAPSASLPVNLSNDVVVGAAASIAALNIDLLTGSASGWYDAANFHSVAIQIIGSAGITAGAIFFEETNDITNASAGNIWQVEETNTLTPTPNIAAITIAASTIRMFKAPVISRYVRVRVSTAFATANVQAVAVFSQMPFTKMVQTIHQPTAGNLNVTASGTVTANLGTGGTSATSLGKAKASAAGATDTGIALLPQRTDVLATQSATGQYILAQADKLGAIYTRAVSTGKRTYSASMVVTPAATATDIVQIIGSATTLVSINRITISGTQTTGSMVKFVLAKRSTANTGGTFTSPTLVPHDSADAAATTVISNYTANPTSTGTLVGNIRQQFVPFSAAAGTTNNIYTFEFGDKGKPVVLNGVAQTLAINLNGATVAGASVNIDIEFTEEI